jgi:uridine kinase
MNSLEKKYTIAIVGGSGAGKTWLADRLETELGGAGRLAQDDFYRDQSHLRPEKRARLNFDDPKMIDWERLEQALDDYQAGGPVLVPSYDFSTHSRRAQAREVPIRPCLLADGLWLLRRRSLRRRFDFCVYIDGPQDVRLARRLARDTMERGRTEQSVREQFAATVQPMHDKFVAPQAHHADVVLRLGFGEEEMAQLINLCRQRATFTRR